MSDSKVFDVHSLPSVSHYDNSWLVILGVKCIVCRTLCVQFFQCLWTRSHSHQRQWNIVLQRGRPGFSAGDGPVLNQLTIRLFFRCGSLKERPL